MHGDRMTHTSLLLLALVLQLASAIYAKSHWDYIVIGAGPGGLQMGYFLQRADRDYVMLERSNTPGSFFTEYPRHDKLLSINKRYTGRTNKEFNLRHDWNSLLSDDESLLMRHYSKEFFPHRADLVKYLQDYQRKLDLNVQFNTNISNIRRDWNSTTKEYIFYMDDQRGRVYTCRNLILATGTSVPNIPPLKFMHFAEGYETMSIDPKDYEGKNVMILGSGNSAFETADAIYGHTNMIHVISRSANHHAYKTHYVGDIRAVNNNLLDTIFLKSLDGKSTFDLKSLNIEYKDGRFWDLGYNAPDNDDTREPYDKIIRCMGFVFDRSIFNSSCEPAKYQSHKLSKYPSIRYNHEVANIPGMFIAGTAAHSIDHRKSAGGFIHGFRYTIRSLHRMLEWRNHKQPWPVTTLPADDLLTHMLKRINEASGTYQMFGVLGDLYNIRSDGKIDHMEEIPLDMFHLFDIIGGRTLEKIMVVVMQYGGSAKDSDRVAAKAHTSYFLHPVIYYYETLPTAKDMEARTQEWKMPRPDRLFHMVEDLLTLWTAPMSHIQPLRHFLDTCLGKDLRKFYSSSCFEMALTHTTVPANCGSQYMEGGGLLDNLNTVPTSTLPILPSSFV